MEETNLCNIHQVKLEEKKASTFLGYPAQEVFDVDNMFPYHGLWSELGGCVVLMDENGEVANEYENDVEVLNILIQKIIQRTAKITVVGKYGGQ